MVTYAGSRTSCSSTVRTNVRPIPAEYVTEAFQLPSTCRTQATCSPSHQRPSSCSTSTERRGSNIRTPSLTCSNGSAGAVR